MKHRADLSQHVIFTVACALAVGCGGGDDVTFRAPTGFAGTGGLVGPSGVAAAPTTAGAGASGTFGSGSSNPQPGLAGGGTPAQAGSGAAPAANLPDGTCATAATDTNPITPTIWLIVDGSMSMTNLFASGRDRWQTLRASLMDPGGIVDSLQSVARFGMVIYAGGAEDANQCVQLVTVQPALDNHAAIAAAYPQHPLASGTPTDKAIDHVVNNLPVTNMQVLDGQPQPTYVVLATDGQPNDLCGNGGGGGGDGSAVQQRVVDVVTRGTASGMNMYVISLAGSDASLQAHLEDVAMATETKTPPFTPASQADLISTFQQIIGGASCQIDLKGNVEQGHECSGKVTLNGSELACASDDGWRLLDPDTFALTGSACSKFLSTQSLVNAAFPCEVFRPD